MNLIKDILPIFKKHEIAFKEKYREVGNIYTFIFGMDQGVRWEPGQHGVFTIKHTKIKKPTRAFSIASTPSEGQIKISMKIPENPSEFKKALLELQPGMKVAMRGPIGSMYTEEQKPLLFIAGGIGITPYRALVKNLQRNTSGYTKEVKLLYMDSKEQFIYTEEFNKAGKTSPIETNYLVNREKLYGKIDSFIAKHSNEAEYFVAGPKSMTKAIEKALKDKGVTKKNIKKDPFIGY
jgi:ferredoxin-NADP reductase